MTRSHDLLGHHEVLVLRSIDALLALDGSHSVAGLDVSADLTYGSDVSDSAWASVCKLLDGSGSV